MAVKFWLIAFHHVSARIPDFEIQDAPLIRTDQANISQILVKPAFTDQLPVAVERITFARDANSSALKNFGEFPLGINEQYDGAVRE